MLPITVKEERKRSHPWIVFKPSLVPMAVANNKTPRSAETLNLFSISDTTLVNGTFCILGTTLQITWFSNVSFYSPPSSIVEVNIRDQKEMLKWTWVIKTIFNIAAPTSYKTATPSTKTR
jgi:hypothetical protein